MAEGVILFLIFVLNKAPMIKSISILAAVIACSTSTFGQAGNWSATPYVSHSTIFGDVDTQHPTKSLNPGIGFMIEHNFTDNFQGYVDFSYGTANGGTLNFYYETQYLQGLLGAHYNLVGALSKEAKLTGNLDVTLGWNYIQAYGFNAANDQLVAKVPANGAYSEAPVLGAGFNLSYPVSNQVDIAAGYRTLWMYDNDWVDAKGSGNSSDYIGQVYVGVKFALNGHQPMAKVSEEDYANVVALKKQAEEKVAEARAELESNRRKYDAQIEDMYNVLSIMNNNIDSLNEKITILRSNPNTSKNREQEYTVEGGHQPTQSNESLEAQWRIVIGSFPTAALARNFADRKPVEGGDYEIVFITDLKTYRVVYNSYPSLEAAKAEIATVRRSIGEAWIVKF